MTLDWTFSVDWNNDGAYTGENEAYWLRGLTIRRGREFMIEASGQGFDPVIAGEFQAILDNQDGRYNPYNASSALYPNVKPGRRVQIKAQLVESPFTVWTLFTGQISDIQPSGVDDRTVTISGVDNLVWLDQQELSDTIKSSYAVSDAINDALTSAGWFTAGFTASIDDNGDTIPWFWAGNQQALTLIRQLENAFLGRAFIDASGVFNFYSRHHSYTSVATIDQADCLKNMPVPQPWEVVRNIIKVNAYPRQRQALGVIWSLQSPLWIGAGESVQFYGDYSYNGENCPATNVQNLSYGTDFLVNTLPDGSGSNITTLSGAYVKNATSIRITINNIGTVGGYLWFCQVRGDALTAISAVRTLREDATSKTAYLPREFVLDSEFLQDPNIAIDLANWLLTRLKDPAIFPEIQIDTKPDLQFAPDLFDQITLTASSLGISDNYLVSYIEHAWGHESGQAVTTRIKLELPIDLSGYWMFSTNIGTKSYFGF